MSRRRPGFALFFVRTLGRVWPYLDYLESSNKILIDKGEIVWTFPQQPETTATTAHKQDTRLERLAGSSEEG
jgi:hypothetical protein